MSGFSEQVETPGRRRWIWYGLIAVVAVVAVVGGLLAQAVREQRRPLPSYPAMNDQPRPQVSGTVAYYDGTTSCVRLVELPGGETGDAYCLDPVPDDTGPVTGPHLSFRPDGRLEITAFRWPTQGTVVGEWQVVVDLETGEVEEIPSLELPTQPVPSPIPAVGPNGQELTAEVRDQRLVIDLVANGETRELLKSAKGPANDYFVGAGGQPVWSSTGEFVVLFDGRLLLTTVADPSTTRILVDYPGADGFGCCWSSDEIRRFAVTDRTYALTESGPIN